MSVLWLRSLILATAELLLNFHISEIALYILLKLMSFALNELVTRSCGRKYHVMAALPNVGMEKTARRSQRLRERDVVKRILF